MSKRGQKWLNGEIRSTPGFRRELLTVVDSLTPKTDFLRYFVALDAMCLHRPLDSDRAVIGYVVAVELFSIGSQVVGQNAAEPRVVFRLSVHRVMIRFNALVIEPQPNEGLLEVPWIACFGCSAANPADQ